MFIKGILDKKGDRIITVTPKETITTITEILSRERIGALLVTGEGGHLEGIVSERDVIKIAARHGSAVFDQQATALMSRSLITCNCDTNLEDALALMSENRIRHLPVLREGKPIGHISVRDILDFQRQILEEQVQARTAQLERARDEADRANKSKSEFLASMSHEIRTPMNGVLGMVGVLAQTPLTADQLDSVETIKESGDALLELLNDILDLSKIEAGRMDLEFQDFSIASLLKATDALWQTKAQEKGITFAIRNELNDNDLVRSDKGRLRQIIFNLIGNAIKFTSEGSVELLATEKVLDNGKFELRFEVRDSGIGLTEEETSKLFKPFSQADRSTSRKFGGTGLGLSISKQLAEMLGGEIGVRSKSGEGSTFWFTAIAEPGAQQAASTTNDDGERDRTTVTGKETKNMRILVAEDNPINQKVVRRLLKPLDCQLDKVENSLEAVAAVARTSYDLILMDVQMPEMDGPTAAGKIRSLPDPVGAIPIIVLTANAMHGDRERYLAAGMTDYVSKPIDQQELFDAIGRCAKVAMPNINDPAFSEEQSDQGKNEPLSQEATEALDSLVGGLDDLLKETG